MRQDWWRAFVCVLFAAVPTMVLGGPTTAATVTPVPWIREVAALGTGLGSGQRRLTEDDWKRIDKFQSQIGVDAQRKLQLTPEQVESFVRWQVISGATPVDQILIEVRVDRIERAAAKKFIEDEFAALQKLLDDLIQQDRTKAVEAAQKQLSEMQKARDAARAKVRALRNDLQSQTGEIDVTPAALTAAATKLQTEFQQISLDREAKEARHKALEEAIAKLTKEVEAKVKDDPVAAELQKVVDVRERALDRINAMVDQEKGSKAEVDEKVGEVAEARAKLMERKRDAAAEAGGTLIAQLNKDLLMMSIDSAEENTRYDILRARSEALRKGVDQADQLAAAKSDAEHAESSMDQAQNALTQAQKELTEGWRPDVRVVESQEYSEPAH